jgi:DNA-binding protein HU-beta
MKRKQLVEKIAADSNITQVQADKALNSFINAVVETVKAGEKISMVGFGTFERRERSARNGINPSTGQTISIPASFAPAFKAGKKFKETVNNK